MINAMETGDFEHLQNVCIMVNAIDYMQLRTHNKNNTESLPESVCSDIYTHMIGLWTGNAKKKELWIIN